MLNAALEIFATAFRQTIMTSFWIPSLTRFHQRTEMSGHGRSGPCIPNCCVYSVSPTFESSKFFSKIFIHFLSPPFDQIIPFGGGGDKFVKDSVMKKAKQ